MGTGRAYGDRVLRGRPDVLTYTSDPLPADLDVVGVPQARLYVTSKADSADCYVRVCDLAPSGQATYVSDGLRRCTPMPSSVEVELWPTAYRFKRGHRIRVQVTGGAFPRWDRNLGTGQPPGAATDMRPVRHLIHHDPARPSAVVFPVWESSA
jgi:putative CocE/NonD family hydrolase